MSLFEIKKIFITSFTCFLLAANLKAQDSLSQYILTPKTGPAPRINGPKIFGVRPGHPYYLLFLQPVIVLLIFLQIIYPKN
jgi:alpha-galactosidase